MNVEVTRQNRFATFQNMKFHWAGAAILVLNKVRHKLQGYRTPRPFSVSDVQRAVEYDLAVVQRFRTALREYAGESFANRRIAELGPGADLGVGLVLLAEGAETYAALDVHNLAPSAPDDLYQELFRRVASEPEHESAVPAIRDALECWRAGTPGRLDYVVDPDFNVKRLAGRGVDLVLSNAAFEHFDDVSRVAADLATVIEPGALLIAEIDLQTHSRWVREADPLNIYRYSDLMYRMWKFKGSPNRWRPRDYVAAFERAGWNDVVVKPLAVLPDAIAASVIPSLNGRFRSAECQMEILSFVLCARKD